MPEANRTLNTCKPATLVWPVVMAALVWIAATTTAQEPLSVHDILEPIRAKYDLPALGGCVIKDGETAALDVAGVRKYGADVAATDDDSFHLGSCTKAMTATLVGMLIDEGKLRWDTTLPEVFPDLANWMKPAYKKATIEHLLAHRAGLPENSWPKRQDFLDIHNLPGTPREQRTAYLVMMLGETPTAEPGEAFVYSNAGYAILGAILERITNTEWEKLIADRIFAPLGMSSAGFGAMGSAGALDQPLQHKVVEGVHRLIGPGKLSDNPPAIAPGGRVHCKLADWAKFVRTQLGANAETPLLKPETLERLHTPPFGGEYAGGWGVCQRDWAGGTALTHSGSNTMNFAVAWLSPGKKFAVLVVTNQDDDADQTEKACDEAAAALIERFLNE